MLSPQVTVYVFPNSPEEYARALQLLAEAGAVAESQGNDHMLRARTTLATVDQLREAGLEVELLSQPTVEATAASSEAASQADPQAPVAQSAFIPPRRSKRTDPELQNRVREMELRVPLEPEGPACYRISFTRPLTSEDQTALLKLGVKIANYRRGYSQAFLDAVTTDRLRQLDFVLEVRPYSLLDTVTTDLLVELEEYRPKKDSSSPSTSATQPSPVAQAAPVPSTHVAADERPQQILDVAVHQGSDLPAVMEKLKGLEGVVIQADAGEVIRFSAPYDEDLLSRVASWHEVRSLGLYRAPTLFSDCIRRVLGADAIGTFVQGAGGPVHRWTGAQEVIGILDSGIDQTHPDFGGPVGSAKSRLRAVVSFQGCDADDSVGHGTHVAGIAAGSGKASGGTVRGMAPDAELVIVAMVRADNSLALPLDMSELLRKATDQGATIINCSWAKKINSTYDSTAHKIDEFAWENPEILIVVAAGNEGAFTPTGERRYYTLGSPGSAKNIVTVGACGSDRSKLPFDTPYTWSVYKPQYTGQQGTRLLSPAVDDTCALSSSGPTDSLGLKPLLLAPGTFILAPRSKVINPFIVGADCSDYNNRYVYMHGTSMAAPAVSGAAAILRQYLREELNTPHPSSALLRALLVGATRPVSRMDWAAAPDVGFPDFDQGFGRLSLELLLPQPGAAASPAIAFADVGNSSNEALASEAAPGAPYAAYRKYNVPVSAGAGSLCFVLTWTDRPGAGLVSDLQLAVKAPDGQWHYGNETLKSPDATALPAQAPISAELVVSDRHNNVEKISLAAPLAGTYLLRVWARNTVQGPQGYAVAVVGNVQHPLT